MVRELAAAARIEGRLSEDDFARLRVGHLRFDAKRFGLFVTKEVHDRVL